jgi:Domain of unknown function (DUF4440)
MSIDDDARAGQPLPEERLEIGDGGRWPPPTWASRAKDFAHGHRLLLVVVAAAALAAAGGIIVAANSQDDGGFARAKAEVLALERREQRAAVNGDSRDLAEVLAPEVQMVTPDGDELTKEEYLDAVGFGDLDYTVFKPVTPMEVRIDGGQAVVTFTSQLEVSADGLHVEHHAWHTVVYKEREGRWQMVWSQTTAIGGFPPKST